MRQWFSLLVLSFLVLGCGGGGSSTGGSTQAEAGTSSGVTTFRIQLPTQAPRGILAQEVRIDRVTVAVSSNGSVVRTAETNVAAGQTTVDIAVAALPPGEYTIQVDGFQGATLLATDQAAATLTADQSTTVTLTLTFVIPLSIDPVAFNLIPTATQQLTASRGTTAVTAVWASDAPAIATVDQNGLVTGVSVGTANITATENGDTVTSVATVTNVVTLNTIDIEPENITLMVGETQQYRAFGNFSDASRVEITTTATWSSTDTDVANINATTGFATADGDGTTTIQAQQDGVTGNTDLDVNSGPPTVDFITVTPTNATINLTTNLQYTCEATLSDSSVVDITDSVNWSSSQTGVADINTMGEASPNGVGVTMITADEGTVQDTVTLTVVNNLAPGNTFATDTDPGYIGDDRHPDVAIKGQQVMVVKAHENGVSDSHVLLERFTVDGSFANAVSNGPMEDFGTNPPFVTNGTTPTMQMDFRPSVTVNQDTNNDVAVVYEEDNGITARLFDFATLPTGAGTNLASTGSPRNPSISMNTPTPPSIGHVVAATFSQGFRNYVIDFFLGNPSLPGQAATTTSTLNANDVAVSESQELSVRVWLDDSAGPGAAQVVYQTFNSNVGGTPNSVFAGAAPLTGDFREVSCSMFDNGDFVIVFSEQIDPNTSSIRGASFNAAGVQQGGVFQVPTFLEDINTVPDVEVIEGTQPSFYVIWRARTIPTDNVGAVRLGRQLFPTGANHPVSTSGGFPVSMGNPPGTNDDPPAVDVNALGAAVVVWTSKPGTGQGRVFGRPIPANADLNF